MSFLIRNGWINRIYLLIESTYPYIPVIICGKCAQTLIHQVSFLRKRISIFRFNRKRPEVRVETQITPSLSMIMGEIVSLSPSNPYQFNPSENIQLLKEGEKSGRSDMSVSDIIHQEKQNK